MLQLPFKMQDMVSTFPTIGTDDVTRVIKWEIASSAAQELFL